MSRINYSAVRNKVKNSTKFEVTIDKKIKKNFEELKNNFIQDFESHPVTEEISQGPTASNNSGTLNGIGNLFSYIGFQRGSDPIRPVREFIRNAFKLDKLKSKTVGNKININYKISYPTDKDLDGLTRMPWESGNSWLIGIERGISGFGSYIAKRFEKGRSGEALQSENRVRTGTFKPVKYMSEIVTNFVKSVKSIK
jgi:hypothetical protein